MSGAEERQALLAELSDILGRGPYWIDVDWDRLLEIVERLNDMRRQ